MGKSFPLVNCFVKAHFPPINSNDHYYIYSNNERNNTIISLS